MAEATMNRICLPLALGQAPAAQREGHAAPAAVGTAAVLLAAMIFVNESVFRVNDPEQFSVDWQIVLRLAVCGACGLYGLFYLRRTFTVLERFPALWLVLFGLWSLVTVPFAVHVPYAAVSCVALWCILLFVPALLSNLREDLLQRVILIALWVFILGSWVMYFAAPELGRMKTEGPTAEATYRLAGLTHANKLGQQVVLTMLWMVIAARRQLVRWRLAVPLLGFALVTLLFTGSRTAMISGAVAAGVVGLRGVRPIALMVGGLILASVLVIVGLAVSADPAAVNLDAILQQASRTGEAEEIYNLTGRTEIWNYAVHQLLQSPILGYGYACSRFVMVQANQFIAYHAHNLLLDVALETGIPGALLLVAMMLTLLRGLWTAPCAFPDTITLVLLVAGLTEPVVFSAVPNSSTVFWFMAILWRQVYASPQRSKTNLQPA